MSITIPHPLIDKPEILPEDPVLDVLRLARERVARGWCQRALVEGDGDTPHSYCAVGALIPEHKRSRTGRWSPDHSGRVRAVSDASDALRRLLPGDGQSYLDVVYYNNHWSTTQADVIAWFDAAINQRRKHGR